MMKCKNCKMPIRPDIPYCPNCGAPNPPKNNRKLLIVILINVAFQTQCPQI